MPIPKSHAVDATFSLVCSDCDAGSHIESYEHATAEGWSNIDYAPSLQMANYIGLCPECREEFKRWPTIDTRIE